MVVLKRDVREEGYNIVIIFLLCFVTVVIGAIVIFESRKSILIERAFVYRASQL